MKKIVLFGAFDRYNYGDNLMPILFEMYIKKYCPELLASYELEYAAISESDLSRYSCKKTVNIQSFVGKLPEDSAIVVIGGEVLCARVGSLFLHMQKNKISNFFLRSLKKAIPFLYKKIVSFFYPTKWEFPYVVPLSRLGVDVRVAYNTVGGNLNGVSAAELEDISIRLKNAAYLSVRDKRTQNAIGVVKHAVLSPDSACLMSDLVDDTFLDKNVRPEIRSQLFENYIVFQAAPKKIGSSIETIANQLSIISRATGYKIVLLPIGYASGHDDCEFLSKLHKSPLFDSVMLNELNIWEIMFAIKGAQVFVGTSLHGIITAMSFAVPYFGINKDVVKLDSFLNDWGAPMHDHCYSVEEIQLFPDVLNRSDRENLKERAEALRLMVKRNNKSMIESLTLH